MSPAEQSVVVDDSGALVVPAVAIRDHHLGSITDLEKTQETINLS